MVSIEVDGISKSFGSYKALDHVTLSIGKGKVFGLLGPNGAGKTTLIRILMQIYAPDEGEVRIDGKKLSPDHMGLMGYLPEERGLYKKMTVGEQALFFAQLKGMNRSKAEKELKKWFEKFDILSWWNRKVEELSKGMAQKVQFIITVVHRPKLIIFDEPFSGFDPINVELLKNELLNLRNDATILFSTHDMKSVEELCDEIALINKSKIILSGEVGEIKKRFNTNVFAFRFQYEGKPETFFTHGTEIRYLQKMKEFWEAIIYIPDQNNLKQILQNIVQQGYLLAYYEVLPSFHSIFISQVTGQPINEVIKYEKNWSYHLA
ncbi:MAG: ATP-binding cassette domain-containing protein [Bacteroidales bacterium]|nr:ATP-binding cassette domain-containing protein [Bacteroidales bacterium]